MRTYATKEQKQDSIVTVISIGRDRVAPLTSLQGSDFIPTAVALKLFHKGYEISLAADESTKICIESADGSASPNYRYGHTRFEIIVFDANQKNVTSDLLGEETLPIWSAPQYLQQLTDVFAAIDAIGDAVAQTKPATLENKENS